MSDDEEPFVVEHETLLIGDEWFEVENAVHFVADGQEYIFLDDKCYELNGSVLGDPMGSVVRHESVYFKGEKYDLENTPHVEINGQEYISIDGKWYELNGAFLGNEVDEDELERMAEEEDAFPYEPPQQPGGRGSILIPVLCFLIAAGATAMVMSEYGFTKFDIDPPASVIAVGTATPTATSSSISVTRTATPRVTPTPVTSYGDTQASKIVEAMDYTNPTTRDFALSLIDKDHGGNYNIAQICDMWEKIYKRWTYVNDPKGTEYYSPASRTINLGLKGDCDDFAILVASTMLAIGGTPRVILASDSVEGHAYAEICIANNKDSLQKAANYICQRYKCKNIAYRTANANGQTQYWLNLDWSSKHPGGSYFQNDGATVAIYPNKHWVRLK
ncbi:transglutaminase-like domain-containing protein [Methanoculleus horonobensis]|uniref:transglutaminase-like domain-containing protein n=1 Tax=Methanoculleus horonobensis TaxID=528314 RepID=UPI00082C3CB4|nr:transglutaminase-like domain-containing protein [Methanoculleus horonobensis]